MKAKHMLFALACAGLLGAVAPASEAQAQDSIYVPIFSYRTGPFSVVGVPVHPATIEHLSFVVVGALILFFLIVEPAGLARLWQIGKQKLRVWPFPY